MENGYPEYFGKVINAINFIAMDLQIDGQTIDLATTPYEDFSLELDMQNGVLFGNSPSKHRRTKCALF